MRAHRQRICPQCGLTVSVASEICVSCGFALVPRFQRKPTPPPARGHSLDVVLHPQTHRQRTMVISGLLVVIGGAMAAGLMNWGVI